MKVYLDYASTTPLLPEVKEAMIGIMDKVYGNPSSIHSFGRQAKNQIEESRKIIANSIHASLGEIFFTSGATESNNMVLFGAVNELGVQRIISSKTEHHCVLHTLDKLKERENLEIILLDVNTDGEVSLEQLEHLLINKEKKTLVSLMHANNEIGTMLDLEKVSKICENYGALLHSDIAQSYGKYPMDVSKMKIHFLSAVAHKLYGPKGVGFVYINGDNTLKPMIFGGSQERNMRAGTENIIGIVGFAKAAELAFAEIDERHERTLALRNYFESHLMEHIKGLEINGTRTGLNLYNISNISFPESEKGDLMVFNLDISGIAASSGSACSSGVEIDSHVLQAINHDPKRKAIRFSFSHLTTKEEVDFVVENLIRIAN